MKEKNRKVVETAEFKFPSVMNYHTFSRHFSATVLRIKGRKSKNQINKVKLSSLKISQEHISLGQESF